MAFNLRRFFHERCAFPFDWWITNDSNGFAQFLVDLDVEKLYNPNQLRLTDDSRAIVHETYRLELYHEFPRVSSEENAVIASDYLLSTSFARRRTLYLINRLKALGQDGSRILFIRATEHCEVISAALRKSFSGVNWDLAFLGRVYRDGFDWRGDPGVWDRTLQGLGVTRR